MDNQEVLFEEIPGKNGDLGVITLNRPGALNSLNHSMIIALYDQMKIWAVAKNIKAMVIRANGRAFCAGGDLRHTYDRFRQHDATLAKFFHDEYQLNRFIFHLQKPYIALLDGITMGGGVGISIHGSHRVATENLLFAMPETAIGFFPDVGGTYFLPRLSENFGYYLGLTGARLKADDCVWLGIATQKIAHERLSELIRALADQSFINDPFATVTNIINQFQEELKPFTLTAEKESIKANFACQTMEEIIQRLQSESSEFSHAILQELNKKSPTSLKITLRALQMGSLLEFDACMRQEYRLVSHFLQGHDFAEGIRALIIDKDQVPKWQPATLKEVSLADVESYFLPVQEELM